MSFSEALKILRLKSGLTQTDISKKLNISRVAYTNYELGNREPDFETLKRIAKIYNTTTDFLLGFEKTTSAENTAYDIPNENSIFIKNLISNVQKLSANSISDLKNYIELLLLRDEYNKFRLKN